MDASDDPSAARAARPARAGLWAALAGVAMAALAGLLLWWRGPGPEAWLSEAELSRALAERWGVGVELQGLKVRRDAAEFHVHLERLVLRSANEAFEARAEDVTVVAVGDSLATLRIASAEAQSASVVAQLDSAGQPKLPPALARAATDTAPPRVEVDKLALKLSAPGGVLLHAPRLSLRVAPSADAEQVHEVHLRGARADLAWNARTARLSDLNATWALPFAAPRATAAFETALEATSITGRVQFSEGRVHVELPGAEYTLHPAPNTEANTNADAATVRAKLAATLDAQLDTWEWRGQVKGELHVAALAALGALPFEGTLATREAHAELSGTVQLAGHAWPLHAQLDEAGLLAAQLSGQAAPISPVLAALGLPLDGPAQRGDAEVRWQRGTAPDTQPLHATLLLPNAELGGVVLERLALEVHAGRAQQPTQVTARARRMRWRGIESTEPRATLRYGVEPSAPSWSGNVTLPALRLDAYLAHATGARDLGGSASASIELVRVNSSALSDWSARVTLTELRINQGEVELRATQALVAELNGGLLKVRATRLQAPDAELTLSGEGPPSEGVKLALTGTGQLAGLDAAYAAITRADGQVRYDLQLTGPWSAPTLHGAIEVHDAELACFGETLREASARLTLHAGTLQLEEARARVRDGQLHAHGHIALDGLRFGATSLHVELGDFAIEPAPGATAKLRLEGQWNAAPDNEHPRLSGTLKVLHGAYRRAMPLQALPALLAHGLSDAHATGTRGARVALDLELAFEPPVRIRNNLADVTLHVDPTEGLHIGGSDAAPALQGRLALEGRLRFQSNEFQLDRAGFEFRPETGLWPRSDLSASTARGVRLRMSGPASDLALSVRCNSAPDSVPPFQCHMTDGNARCDRFEDLVARFQCNPTSARSD